MTSPVLIGGKRTVQRISIRFPKREGQSRISIRFQAVERGCSSAASAIWTRLGVAHSISAALRVVAGFIEIRQAVSQSHTLSSMARPLVKFRKQASGCCTKVFHTSPLSFVGYVPSVGERGLPCPTQEVSISTQDMSPATQDAAARKK